MNTRHILLPAECFSEGTHTLTGKTAHYLRNVLRIQPQQTFTAIDGQHTHAQALCLTVSGENITLQITHIHTSQSTHVPHIVLATAVPKGERADWLVEKTTELGVSHIAWIAFERSVAIPQAESSKMLRFQRIAEAATMQSKRLSIPSISPPIPLPAFVHADQSLQKYVGHTSPSPTTLHINPEPSISLVIGPEGGFTHQELELLMHSGYNPIQMAPFILRTETAAAAGLALLQHHNIRNV
jgi:16S rRNA (uracil1498-N3)-methyltransferase